MTLKQMRYTIAVAGYKSFNEAAKRLYVSQPSLTGAVQGLEEELGFLIFKRNRSGVELTAKGKEYLNRIQAIVEQVDELETAYHNEAKPTDYFSVSAQHYNFPVEILLRMIHEAGSHYRFFILETRTKEVIRNVAEGVSELGILYFSQRNKAVLLRELRIRGISFHPLTVCSPCVYMRKHHPLAGTGKIRMRELEPYPFVTFYQGEDSSNNFVEEIIDFTQKSQIIYISDKSSGWHILKYTDAYSIGSGMLDSEWSDDVITVPLMDCDEMTIGWIQKKRAKLSEMAEYFLKTAAEVFDKA